MCRRAWIALLFAACASPARVAESSPPMFAAIDVHFVGLTMSDERLEVLAALHRLFGPDVFLDLERQLVHVHVHEPMRLDFSALARAFTAEAVGVLSVSLQAPVSVEGDRVTIQPTGQSFPLHGVPPADTGTHRRDITVLFWSVPGAVALDVDELDETGLGVPAAHL